MKFSEFRQLSEATKDLMSAIGSTKTNALLKKKVIPEIQSHHDKVFGVGNNHLEFPLENDIPEHVKSHVEENGDSLTNNGIKLKSGREVPISKYLARSNAPKNVQDEHQNWEKNKVANSKLVITRHPAEVVSCSTNTHWDSCANPHSGDSQPAWKAMPAEIKHGTLMAMYVHKDAKPNEHGEYNSKDILGRTLIKYHEPDGTGSKPENKKEITFHREDRKYGAFPESANKVVDDFTKHHYPQTNMLSRKHKDLYDDDNKPVKVNVHHKDIEHAFTIGHEKELGERTQTDIVKNPEANEKIFSNATNSAHLLPKREAAKKTTNPETLHKIFHTKIENTTVHSKDVLRNPHVTTALIDAGMSHKDPSVRATAVSSKNATTTHLDKAINDADADVRNEVGRHHKATPAHLDKALSDNDKYVRMGAVRNPNANPEHLHKALQDRNSDIRIAAMEHKNINSSHITKALDDNNDEVQRLAAEHSKATPKHLHKALDDGYPHVRISAASNKNATKDVLEKAAKDDNEEVKIIGTQRLKNGDFK